MKLTNNTNNKSNNNSNINNNNNNNNNNINKKIEIRPKEPTISVFKNNKEIYHV